MTTPAEHQRARALISAAFALRHGYQPSVWTAQNIQAQALGESGYGKWNFWNRVRDAAGNVLSKTPVPNQHNWGAIQSVSPTATHATDSYSNGRIYDVYFMAYPNDEAGVADLVRHMTTLRPLTFAAIQSGSLHDVSDAMRRENYYGGFCTQAAKKYGERVNHKGDAEAWNACHEEAVDWHSTAFKARFAEMKAGGVPIVDGPEGLGKASGPSAPSSPPGSLDGISYDENGCAVDPMGDGRPCGCWHFYDELDREKT